MTALKRHPPLLVRDSEAGRNSERFFVAAIATLLAIRAFLAATGYPQLGGRHMHIAHVLWGGLALAVALLLLLISIGRHTRPLAAIIGGIGFGFFIDELGKFLTRDNDYFYQPAIALIYFVLVGLFLAVRFTLSRRTLTSDERLANAITLMKDIAVEELDEDEKAQVLELLDGCDPVDPRVELVRDFLDRLSTVPAPPPGRFERLRHRLVPGLDRIVMAPGFGRVLGYVFVVQSAVALGWALVSASSGWTTWEVQENGTHLGAAFAGALELASTVISAALVLAGVTRMRRSRVQGYRMFRRAVRVAILVTQFFVFYDAQLGGVVWLAVNLLLLGMLDYLIAHHEAAAAAARAPAATTARTAPAAVQSLDHET